MGATKQADSIVAGWTETQMKMWDSWLEAVLGATGMKAPEGWEHVYKVTLTSLEGSVKTALEAQTEWTQMWAEGLPDGQGAPEEVVQGARLVQEMFKGWIETQRRLWDGWFEIARKLDPTVVTRGWERVLGPWQQTVRKAAEAQKEWATAATREAAPKAPKGKETPG